MKTYTFFSLPSSIYITFKLKLDRYFPAAWCCRVLLFKKLTYLNPVQTNFQDNTDKTNL